MFPLLLLACTGAPSGADTAPPADTAPTSVAWAPVRPALEHTSPGGRPWKRGIIHLHSHYSHDACDGEPMVDGVPREDCLADLRRGLCATGMDFAFVTDHPSYFAWQPYADTLLVRHEDEVVDGVANRMSCLDSTGTEQRVLLMPGVEDELMPVGLRAQVSEDAEAADAVYNAADQATFDAERGAGALVLQAHTEGKALSTLQERRAMGLTGVEMFNLHAMFDPDIREEDLGLESFGYLDGIAPFVSGETDAQPDLAFLAVYEEQGVSLSKWDALNRDSFTVGTAGTDAHENVMPALAPDGERFDSYRRMMSWFSNVLLPDDADGDGLDPDDYQAALAAGRLFVAFEALGTPGDWDVHYGALEMGGEGPVGDALVVSCPTLADTSPREGDAPEISVAVYKDGQLWQQGCGAWTVKEPGVYRAVVTIVPHHLAGFLDDQQDLVRPYPWLYSNALRIGL